MNEQEPSVEDTKDPTIQQQELGEFGEFFKKLCEQIHHSLNPDGQTKLGFSIAVFDSTLENPTAQMWSNSKPDVVYKVLRPWMARMRQAFEKKDRRANHLRAAK